MKIWRAGVGGVAARFSGNRGRALLGLIACLTVCATAAAQTSPGVVASPRGAVVTAKHVSLEIVDGTITQITNLHTQEKLLRAGSDIKEWSKRVPSGLGTIHTPEERQAAKVLHDWPWNEMAEGFKLPNQHFADGSSKVAFKAENATSATLTYSDLTDGTRRFPDESYTFQIKIDDATGDVLITPSAQSKRTGVFSTNLLVAPTRKVISIEAPIFDGMRLTGDMKTNVWVQQSGYWDYPLLAFNGEDRGAVGIWAQDATFRYKALFYKADGNGIATSFCTIVDPPFEKVSQANGVTWRIQAFDKNWNQVAARYRDWRAKEIKVATRPSWVNEISFVNSGVNAQANWLKMLGQGVGTEHLNRTLTFLPVIRAAAFDTKHWDNSAYPKFGEETKAWKEAGAKTLAYLQPMIMWGRPNETEATEEVKRIVAMSEATNTRSAFDGKLGLHRFHDQHHLGQPDWQKWFLACVKNFIDLGADGVYHDQSYPVPIDGRGPIAGKNSVQGMVEYFYNAATQNPNSIHGTEHLTEANIVGASVGIGSGVHWGVAPTVRMQRIRNASPISNALHHPLGVIWAFPHQSQLGGNGDWNRFDWGMDLQERRGDIAGFAIQSGVPNPLEEVINQPKLDWWRGRVFVAKGLRPAFPENWDRSVRSYFRGAKGEDVRYENTEFGSEFVEYVNGKREVIYNRITGATNARTPLNVAGWVFYKNEGPSGLHPHRYYLGDPSVKRPDAYLMPAFNLVPDADPHYTLYESFVDQGTGNDQFLWARIRPLDTPGRILGSDKLRVRAPQEPAAILVNGNPVKFTAVKDQPGLYEFGIPVPSDVVVFLKPVPTDFASLKDRAFARQVGLTHLDGVNPQYITKTFLKPAPVKPEEAATKLTLRMEPMRPMSGIPLGQIHLPMQAEGDKPMIYRLTLSDNTTVALNGMPVEVAQKVANVTLKPGQPGLVSVFGPSNMSVTVELPPAAAPAAAPAAGK